MDLPTLNIVSICTGYGGIDLGIRLAVPISRTVAYVEIEAYAGALLVQRMQEGFLDDAPIWSDAKTFDGNPWRGTVDCIVAGCPCQPFSIAGQRQGAEDPRHLWPSIARIIGECRPPFVFIENVSNHLILGFENVRAELQGLGYRVEAGLFSAAEIGAPHLRKRLFALAYSERVHSERRGATGDVVSAGGYAESETRERQWSRNTADDCEPHVADSDGSERRTQFERGGSGGQGSARERETPDRLGIGNEALAVTNGEHDHGSGRTRNGRPESANDSLELVNPASDDERRERQEPRRQQIPAGGPSSHLPAFPPGPGNRIQWERIIGINPSLEPAICGVVDGRTNRVDELRALGNGVVPIVAGYAFASLYRTLFEG